MSHKKLSRKIIHAGWLLFSTCVLCLQAASQPVSLIESEPELAALLDKLEPMRVESVPQSGTFWLLSKAEPPWPILTPVAIEFGLPIYPVDNNTFIVDDRKVDYVALTKLDSALKAAELELGLATESDGGPPMPGDGEEQGGEGGGGAEPTGWSYSSNVLWLELVRVTNQVGAFVIHTPEQSAAYDLFATTNLSAAVPGLNLTNWAWLERLGPGQTNFIVSGLLSSECYFVLGTMLDSDTDGLTDAYENLTSHTQRLNPDTDGDGLSDGWEVFNGMNPLLNESQLDAYKRTYTYDKGGWLRQVSVPAQGFSLDNEGNVLCAW